MPYSSGVRCDGGFSKAFFSKASNLQPWDESVKQSKAKARRKRKIRNVGFSLFSSVFFCFSVFSDMLLLQIFRAEKLRVDR